MAQPDTLPVIDEEVIFLPSQDAPDVVITGGLIERKVDSLPELVGHGPRMPRFGVDRDE
jgi:hypothetical protein